MDNVATLARQTLSILLVFALLGTALWKLGKFKGGNMPFRWTSWRRPEQSPPRLEKVERLALTPQHSLYVVRVHGTEILVATHPHGCTLLGEAALSSEAGGGAGA